jgi:hypothetical protein
VFVDIIIHPGTFEVVGDPFRTIRMHVDSASSDPAEFFLKAKEKGLQKINATFYQHGTYLGKLVLSTLVTSTDVGADVSEPHITIADWQIERGHEIRVERITGGLLILGVLLH